MRSTAVLGGERYGLLTTINVASHANDGHRIWACLCDCGKTVLRQTNVLKQNRMSSCGCANKFANYTHGKKGSPTYSSWVAAKDRCNNPKSKDFFRYGAVGIQICKKWNDSFQAFFEDMGERPDGTTIDRIDNTKGYEPSNCRWATNSQQQQNRSVSVWVQWKGQKTHLSEIAKELSITYGAAFMRNKRGNLL